MNDLFLTHAEWMALKPGAVLVPFYKISERRTVASVTKEGGFQHLVTFTDGSTSEHFGLWIPEPRLMAYAEQVTA